MKNSEFPESTVRGRAASNDPQRVTTMLEARRPRRANLGPRGGLIRTGKDPPRRLRLLPLPGGDFQSHHTWPGGTRRPYHGLLNRRCSQCLRIARPRAPRGPRVSRHFTSASRPSIILPARQTPSGLDSPSLGWSSIPLQPSKEVSHGKGLGFDSSHCSAS